MKIQWYNSCSVLTKSGTVT